MFFFILCVFLVMDTFILIYMIIGVEKKRFYLSHNFLALDSKQNEGSNLTYSLKC